MTEEQYRTQQGIPETHKFVQTKTTWKAAKGLDTDTYWYDEVDANGNVVAKHISTNSTSMYPPFANSLLWEKDD